MARITFRDILQELNGREFDNERALQEAVRQAFNKRVLDFPPGYTHFDVIRRGLDNDWIQILSNDRLVIQTDEKVAALVG